MTHQYLPVKISFAGICQSIGYNAEKVMVIAQNVGFENVDYFCKMFKKYYKMTPTEYREKHITKGLD